MLFCRFLAKYGFQLSNIDTEYCCSATRFPIHMGMWAEILGLDGCPVQDLESSDEPGYDFRCAVSEVVPRVDWLVEKKQLHFSH